MSQLILENELKIAVTNNSFIKNGSLSCCEGMKYDFRVSMQLLSPRFDRAREYSNAQYDEFVIKPGETAFVMTEEELDLPDNIFCQLSTKRKLSHDGILLLGGFSIDPKYKGKLFFGLYNISNKDYPFIPGKKLVAGIFHKLNHEEAKNITSTPEPLYEFPDVLIKNVKSFKISSSDALEEQLNVLRTKMNSIIEQLDTDRSWKEEFKKGLTENNNQISRLGQSIEEISKKLSQEIDERKLGEGRMNSNYSIVRGIGIVLAFLIGGGVVSLIVLYIGGIFNFG